MIHDIYGDDLENIEDMENKNDEGFRFSTVNFQDHGIYTSFYSSS